ncbi:MAG: pseudaminic acid cytidylyltransferase [Proteobacteria bacterium]|jgi:pseudaminic acid cytidylyltransferase|nr:pseudaminic acid cytidylyltransferase [Pseudomonadota bacterium]
MNVAIIPARGGSKRIPRKNILPFCGKPIIAHSIETAIQSQLFGKVIVSTDDEEIASVSREYGAEVPFLRPPELSDDFTGTHEVVGHAVTFLIDSGVRVDYACCIYATAPLIQLEDLTTAYGLVKDGCWETVFAAARFPHPIHRSFQCREDGGLEMFFPEHFQSRSQDLPIAMHDAGQFCWASANTWINPPLGFTEKSSVVELPSWRVQDIDTPEDWKRAELLYGLKDII